MFSLHENFNLIAEEISPRLQGLPTELFGAASIKAAPPQRLHSQWHFNQWESDWNRMNFSVSSEIIASEKRSEAVIALQKARPAWTANDDKMTDKSLKLKVTFTALRKCQLQHSMWYSRARTDHATAHIGSPALVGRSPLKL